LHRAGVRALHRPLPDAATAPDPVIQSRDGHYQTVGQVLLGNPIKFFSSGEPPFPIT
jgi:hypothetical protein